MAGLNAGFEKAVKALERRLEGKAREHEKTLERAGKRIGKAIERQAEAALRALVANADKIAEQFRLDVAEASRLRQGLETTQGAVGGLKDAAPWAALTPDPRMKAMIFVLGALRGAAVGAVQEEVRLQIQQTNRELERERVDIRRLLGSVDRDVERVRAMRRRTGRLG